uniref:Uncharacterized protein n=1 Tax=Arundo donax TaxID=35708 RepID=A0A0A9CWI9_ARUDO
MVDGSWLFHRAHAAPPNNHKNLDFLCYKKSVSITKIKSKLEVVKAS